MFEICLRFFLTKINIQAAQLITIIWKMAKCNNPNCRGYLFFFFLVMECCVDAPSLQTWFSICKINNIILIQALQQRRHHHDLNSFYSWKWKLCRQNDHPANCKSYHKGNNCNATVWPHPAAQQNNNMPLLQEKTNLIKKKKSMIQYKPN